MKTINQIQLAIITMMFAVFNANAQVTLKTDYSYSHELEVLNQLGSPTAVVNMPVSQLLNAPGNEALRKVNSGDMPCAGGACIC